MRHHREDVRDLRRNHAIRCRHANRHLPGRHRPTKLRVSYGYVDHDQNTILTGQESKLKKLVEGDRFTAKVTVLESYSDDTQAGGNTTVPSLQVDSISVYDCTD